MSDNKIEELLHILKIVQAMRQAQTNFFRERTQYWLKESKRLEKEVDEYIKRIFAEVKQEVMF